MHCMKQVSNLLLSVPVGVRGTKTKSLKNMPTKH
nr:MAG TPA: hypothetical protein [Caudoviricetes sp.]